MNCNTRNINKMSITSESRIELEILDQNVVPSLEQSPSHLQSKVHCNPALEQPQPVHNNPARFGLEQLHLMS